MYVMFDIDMIMTIGEFLTLYIEPCIISCFARLNIAAAAHTMKDTLTQNVFIGNVLKMLCAFSSNFYLIGELDPSGKTLTACTHDPLPPYQNPEVPRVFMQDHMTNVKFKIGQWSLQYAYLNIPDLRSSSVTLGLSVDLSWSQGIDFEEVVIGGNDQTPMPTPAPEEP